MAIDEGDELTQMLEEGWEVIGYQVVMMAMGASSQNILLKSGTRLRQYVIVQNGSQETRGVNELAPRPRRDDPPARRGFFG